MQLDRQKANAEIEKRVKKGTRLTTNILAISQGKDKNEVLADVLEGWADDSGVGFNDSTDTWIRTQSGWKLKSRR